MYNKIVEYGEASYCNDRNTSSVMKLPQSSDNRQAQTRLLREDRDFRLHTTETF